ncbi:PD-(D/E)XK nuclease-like domain-containing protein, partial [Paenibacillus larvae]|nr:PD-(D/E)XK nuclease-like domain-containing protein [Paenibacillus larvae]MCY9527496.1 PD-(D/E)XK nuclease-like domain-containing protein [Paenibacillus larvae]
AGHEEPIRCEKCRYCRETKKLNSIIHYSELLAQ